MKKRIIIGLLITSLCLSLAGCGSTSLESNNGEGVETTEASALSSLSSEEKEVYEAVVKISSDMLVKDSTRLRACSIGRNGYSLYFLMEITAENKMGGTSSAVYYVPTDKDGDDYTPDFSGRIRKCDNVSEYTGQVLGGDLVYLTAYTSVNVDSINDALEEYFS